jgi:predicted amidohydrolase
MTSRSKGTTIAVANLQTRHNKAANLRAIRSFIKEAASKKVQLLVFPEGALQGYPSGTGNHDADEFAYQYSEAETIPGPSTEVIVRDARAHGMTVVFGLTELAGTMGLAGLLFNSVAIVGPDGLLGVYRKVHTGDVEKQIWHRGSEFPVVDTSVGKIGAFICYDVVFAEAARILALQGAGILVMSTAWVTTPNNPPLLLGYDLFTRARALENQVWLAVSNQTGTDVDTGMEYLGRSRIVNPNGEVVLELGREQGLGVATLDIEEGIIASRARGWFGQVFLRDRAPETYQLVADRRIYSPPIATGNGTGVAPGQPARPRAKRRSTR